MMPPTPWLEEWAVTDGRNCRARHRPSPEGFYGGTNGEVSWLRELHSPSRFPSGVVSGGSGLQWPGPVTVAGPRRTCTGFRVAPFVWLQLYGSASLSARLLVRKSSLELLFQPGPSADVGAP